MGTIIAVIATEKAVNGLGWRAKRVSKKNDFLFVVSSCNQEM